MSYLNFVKKVVILITKGPNGPNQGSQPSSREIQFMLDENCQLIQSIIDYQQKGEILKYLAYHSR